MNPIPKPCLFSIISLSNRRTSASRQSIAGAWSELAMVGFDPAAAGTLARQADCRGPRRSRTLRACSVGCPRAHFEHHNAPAPGRPGHDCPMGGERCDFLISTGDRS